MTVEIDKRTKDAEILLRGVRLGMLTNSKNTEHKLYGTVALDLKLVHDDSVLSMGTDGSNLYYNVDFVLGLTKEREKYAIDKLNQLKQQGLSQEEYDHQMKRIKIWYGPKNKETFEFLMRHEIDHVLYSHMERCETRDQQIYNKACDHRINLDIKNSWYKNSNILTLVPLFEMVCADVKYTDKNWTSFDIYDDLVKQSKSNQNQSKSAGDTHVYGDGQSHGETQSDSVTRDILGLPARFQTKGAQQGNPEDQSIASERMKNNFMETAKELGIGEGNQIFKMLKLSKPVVNWKKVLRRNLSGLNKTQNDPKRLSRRVHGLTNTLQASGLLGQREHLFISGKKPEQEIEVYVFCDMSGSIGQQEQIMMLTECYNICQQYNNFKLHVISWDTVVYVDNIKTYTKQNKQELIKHQFRGGGGTDVGCIANYLQNIKFNKQCKFVIISDMYYGNPKPLKMYSNKIIWLSTVKNMQHATQGIGYYIEFDKYSK